MPHDRGMSVQLGDTTNNLTNSPVEPGRFLTPEFLDVDQVRIYFGIKQSLLYRLLSEGKIRAVSIRQRGKTRGRRLFDVASIRAFLNSNVDVDPGVA
jgi:Helix-turn-helix domain